MPAINVRAGRLLRGMMALLFYALLAWPAHAASPARLLLLGDSLIAGYGLPSDQGFAARLDQALKARGLDVTVLNAGVSGDTSAGGLARLDWALADRPTHALVELGANDALRGLDPGETERNLDAILTKLQAAGVKPLLAGMLAPPNLGKEYGAAFRSVYARLATRHDIRLYPFFLDGVAAQPSLNQADGIHPNAAGVEVIVNKIEPYIADLISAEQ